MLELSKIRKNGVDYGIKDSTARQEIETLKQNGGSGGSSGWSTEEITLLELILKKCVTTSDQTNNITSLVAMLQSNSSGSEGSGGGNGGNTGDGDSGSGDSGGGNVSTTYAITLNLTNVIPSNATNRAKEGSIYLNQLSVPDGYALGSVKVTMGGYDVTKLYYDGEGNINITSVSGDIEITCKALAVETLRIINIEPYPDPTTFEYTEINYNQQYVAAIGNTIPGGILSVTWDTSLINGGPEIIIYLSKDGVPYKISNKIGANSIGLGVSGELDIEWQDPVAIGRVHLDAPCTVRIPDGCTVMLAMRGNTLANETVTKAAERAAWMIENLTVTVTEGE